MNWYCAECLNTPCTCEDWLPTPENINALPKPIRDYIHDLVTSTTNPTGLVQENILMKDTIKALELKIKELENER